MMKLYRLKSWYTLADAAARLSLTLAEPITENDVIQLAADGEITVSWFLNGAYSAQQITVSCDYPRNEFKRVRTEPEYDENGESWGHYLSGIFTLPVDLYPPWGWWLLTFIGKGGESGELYSPIVIDADDGSFWAFYGPGGSDFMNFPAKDEIVITRKDIEAFEHHIHSLDAVESADTSHNITSERGCRRFILENWDKIKLLHGDEADGRQVLRVLNIHMDKNEKRPALKTVQNKLIELRNEKLIP